MIWAPMQKTSNAVKIRDPDRVFVHAGAFAAWIDRVLESLRRQIQLILRASKIRKNFQFHTAGKGVQEFRNQSGAYRRRYLDWALALGGIEKEAGRIRKFIL